MNLLLLFYITLFELDIYFICLQKCIEYFTKSEYAGLQYMYYYFHSVKSSLSEVIEIYDKRPFTEFVT